MTRSQRANVLSTIHNHSVDRYFMLYISNWSAESIPTTNGVCGENDANALLPPFQIVDIKLLWIISSDVNKATRYKAEAEAES